MIAKKFLPLWEYACAHSSFENRVVNKATSIPSDFLRLEIMNYNPLLYLHYWAKIKPSKRAILSDALNINYLELSTLINNLSIFFARQGLKKDSTVLTCFLKKEFEWVCSLALLQLGCHIGSGHGYTQAQSEKNISHAVVDQPLDSDFSEKNVIFISQADILAMTKSDSICKLDYQNLYSIDCNRVMRFSYTSGTSGIPKRVDRPMMQIVTSALHHAGMNTYQKQTLDLMRLSSGGSFTHALVTLIGGHTLLCSNSLGYTYALLDKKIARCLSGSPTQIGALINFIDKRSLPGLTIDLVKYSGAPVSKTLMENIKKNLSKKVYVNYGSTEAGAIAGMEIGDSYIPGEVGYVYPNALVEVLDENGNACINHEGILRIKSSNMVTSYFHGDQHLTSDNPFKDGWFYPGDHAILNKDGFLTIVGRKSDFLNRGGVKINPVELDLAIQNITGIEDAAVFMCDDDMGVPMLVAAVVHSREISNQIIMQTLIKDLGHSKTPKCLIKVDQIPKNHMGKVLRRELSDKYGPAIISQLRKKMQLRNKT